MPGRSKGVDVVGRLLWAVTGLSGLLAVLEGAPAFLSFTASAPQQAGSASTAVMLAVVPYVLARAWDELTRPWAPRA